MIGIVNWGGNIGSLVNAMRKIGAAHTLVSRPDELRNCARLILPGVGHFGAVMDAIKKDGLSAALMDELRSGKPYLGICVGMQVLLEESEEAPGRRGLSVFSGGCERLRAPKVPQTGFNRVRSADPLIGDGQFYYFVNSFRCVPLEDVCVATAEYGGDLCAALGRDNVLGVQFHPERSAEAGLRFLRRWCDAL